MHHAFETTHGAFIVDSGMVRFRIWAPSVARLDICLDDGPPQPMLREQGDWFCTELPAGPGTRYHYVLPEGLRVPDPASRLQAGDVHDASVVVDPRAFEWSHDWQGRPWTQTVLYELHPGTMGGFAGITKALPYFVALGITAIELMPINDFPGRRNWGYDGVLPYAPDTAYGTPDELKRLIDTAHSLQIMVFLDVVYNHFGPDGAYMYLYANTFFTDDFHTPWGKAIDFRRQVVLDYFAENALYWIREYRFDGLRFDALGHVQPQQALPALAARIRAGIEPGRQVHLVMEHEYNAASLLRGSFDAQWTDDFHHALHVMMTGETFGYYVDFEDATALMARCLHTGFAYQGEISRHSGQPRGQDSSDLPTRSFVVFAQNHDQIGNRATGDRLAAGAPPAAVRAARALVLLSPFIPLLFMGEEWATPRPFQFFTDHLSEELAALVRAGRRQEFAGLFRDHADEIVPDPNDPATFAASSLDFAEADAPPHDAELALTRALIGLRARYLMPRIARAHGTGSQVLAPGAVMAGWRLDDGAVLRIALNLSAEEVAVPPCPHPLLYVPDAAAAAAVRAGRLPSHSVAVWLSALGADLPPPEIAFS